VSYYRNFANLVSALGVVTLGLVLAAVYFMARSPRAVVEDRVEPAPQLDPARAQPESPTDRQFDRLSIAPLKAPAAVPPPRPTPNEWATDPVSGE
jgi:hypothetical protein